MHRIFGLCHYKLQMTNYYSEGNNSSFVIRNSRLYINSRLYLDVDALFVEDVAETPGEYDEKQCVAQ